MTLRAGTSWQPPLSLSEWPARALLLAAVVAVAFIGGATAQRTPLLVPLALVLPLTLVAMAAASRYTLTPLFIIVITSSASVLVFLPASAGDAGQRSGLESYGTAVALATLLASALVLKSYRDIAWVAHGASAHLDRIMLVFLFLAAVAGAVGLASGNPATFLLGDVYRIVMLPAVYFVTVSCVTEKRHIRSIILLLAIALLAQHTRDAAYSISELASDVSVRAKSVFWIQNLVGLVALATLAFQTPRARERWLLLLGAWFLFGVGLSRGFRTYLLAAAVLMLAPLIMRPANGPKLLRGFVTALCVAAPIVALGWMLIPNTGSYFDELTSSFSTRVELATSGEDASASQRSLELDLVIDRLKGDEFALLAGTGAGTVYQLPYWASPYALAVYADDQGRIHNVHNSYGSMALRCGLAGLGAIIALFAIALWQARSLTRTWPSTLAWFPFLAILGYVLASPFFFFVPGDVIFPIVVGLVGAYQRIRLSETAPSES